MPESCGTRDAGRLGALLERIDGSGYRAYRDLRGAWDFDRAGTPFRLLVDHVQADPFAAPSRMRVQVDPDVAGFPGHTFTPGPRRRALCNYLALRFSDEAGEAPRGAGSGASGRIAIDRPGQQVLERTCVLVDDKGRVEARFVAGLPAAGRRVLGRSAAELLCRRLPGIVAAALRCESCDRDEIDAWTRTAEDAAALRQALAGGGWAAFVADGAVLPRRSGVDDRPLSGAVPFRSPPSLRVELETPNAGPVTGMAVPEGVTLIVGGGFHGKSTLLSALARGVYDHRPGDGRERVVTDPTAVAVRAEDGRSTAGVDLSPFIGDLPFDHDNAFFCTGHASGSTSQAAAIVEALEAGARCLLIDEDTAATNFMIRDGRMQQLVAREQEPVRPFIDRVRQLHEEADISTILVMGGSGDYFGEADTVIAMERYEPVDVTGRAHDIARAHKGDRTPETTGPVAGAASRVPLPDSIDPRRGRREVSWKAMGPFELRFGEESIDLSAVAQLVDAGQTRAIAEAILRGRERYIDGRRSLAGILDRLMADVAAGGLDALSSRPSGDLAGFRRFELAAALNRLRTLRVRRPEEVPA